MAWRLVGMTGASLLVSTLDVIGILLLVPLVEVLSDTDGGQSSIPILGEVPIGVLLGLIVGFFVLKSIGMAWIRWWSTGVVARANAQASARLFTAYLAAPLEFHDQRNSSESIRTVTATIDRVFTRLLIGLTTLLADAASLVVLVLVVVIGSPLGGVAAVAYFGIASLLFVKVVQQRTLTKSRQAERLGAVAVQSVQEGIGGLREQRVRGTEALLTRRFAEDRLAFTLANRFTNFTSELPRYYLEVIFIGGFGVIAGTVVATADGTEALSALAILLAVGFRVLPSISRVLSSANNIRAGKASLEIVLAELDEMDIDRLRGPGVWQANPGEAGSSAGPLTFRNVGFSYPAAEHPALADVTLHVPEGSSLGIVGPSGAGKSTLVDLLCGLRTPASGEVLVGGLSMQHDLGAWRRSVGLVPQDVYLLDAPIRTNVAFGLDEDSGAVWEALERAQLATFVRQLPDGLDTLVGERGTRLSGGQRQRLGIARALYHHPAVLVLDEATAALDVETEAAVVESIAGLAGRQTLIVVAHRLATIRRCDRVAYLDRGHIRSIGTFDEVAQQVPEFAHAVDLAGLAR